MQNFNHRNLFPFLNCHIQKLIDTQQIFVPVYITTDFWLFMATSNTPFRFLKVIAVFLDENSLSFNLLIICSIYVFELMNIKGPTRCPNTVQEPVISINSKTQQKSVTFSFTGTNFLMMIN